MKNKKRLYICYIPGAGYVAGIVAKNRLDARKEFYKNYGERYSDDWLNIRAYLHKNKELDISELPYGEIESKWGYDNKVYTGDESW